MTRTFIFYSQFYIFYLPIVRNIKYLYFDKNTSTITLTTNYTNMFFRTYWSIFLQIFNSFSTIYFKKIKFKGKGYYIFKNKRNTITPQFGYSHRLYLYAYYIYVKFLSKTKILIFGLLNKDIASAALYVRNMRSINIFTGRGVRFSKQIIYKKVGKVSSYR